MSILIASRPTAATQGFRDRGLLDFNISSFEKDGREDEDAREEAGNNRRRTSERQLEAHRSPIEKVSPSASPHGGVFHVDGFLRREIGGV